MDHHNTTDEHVLAYIRLMRGDLTAAVGKLPQSRVYLPGEKAQMKADFVRILNCVWYRAVAYAFRGLTMTDAGDYPMATAGEYRRNLIDGMRQHDKFVRWIGFDGREWEVSTTVVRGVRATSYHVYLTMDGNAVFSHMLIGDRS